MFQSKRKLREKLIRQEARIRELEEILCPCEMHSYVKTGWHYQSPSGKGSDLITVYHYTCRKCKKRIQSADMY